MELCDVFFPSWDLSSWRIMLDFVPSIRTFCWSKSRLCEWGAHCYINYELQIIWCKRNTISWDAPRRSGSRKWRFIGIPGKKCKNPSKIEWDLTNGPLRKLLGLLDTQVLGSVQWVLLEISWKKSWRWKQWANQMICSLGCEETTFTLGFYFRWTSIDQLANLKILRQNAGNGNVMNNHLNSPFVLMLFTTMF